MVNREPTIDVTPAQLARARRRYEWVQVQRALIGGGIWAAGISAIACLNNPNVLTWGLAAAVVVVAPLALWYGQPVRRGVLPGLLVGSLSLSLALAANNFGHLCLNGRCTSWCLPACVMGGLVSGYALAWWAFRSQENRRAWFFSCALALATGAMGCTCIGASGVAGLCVGFAVMTLPWLWRRQCSTP